MTLPSGEFRRLAESNTVVTPRVGPSPERARRRCSYRDATRARSRPPPRPPAGGREHEPRRASRWEAEPLDGAPHRRPRGRAGRARAEPSDAFRPGGASDVFGASSGPMPVGYWCPVLHAHLPYVRHPEYPEFLEEDWLFEALTETYVPLIRVFDGLLRDGVDYRLTMTLSPPLLSMMTDELLIERYHRHLDRLVELWPSGRSSAPRASEPRFKDARALLPRASSRTCAASSATTYGVGPRAAPSASTATPASWRSSPAAPPTASCR